MPANYLHGVETIVLDNGLRPVRVVKSSVIALVGIAPMGNAETLILVKNESDAAQFGKLVPGFNIPKALDAIFAQGSGGPVLVVNVFSTADHTTPVVDEVVTVENLKFRTEYPTISDVVVTNTAGTTTYVNGTDYTWNQFGDFVIPSGSAITEGQSLKVDYNKLDESAVTASFINGAITSGVRTGMQLFDEAYNTFGFTPKIIIAPGYSTLSGVYPEMIEKAEKYNGYAIFDAPQSTTVEDAISNRGVSASANNFQTSNKRAILAYPMVLAYDEYQDDDVRKHYSQYLAGVMAAVDLDEGYWFSPSNHEIKGITGTELPITWGIGDADTDVNALNEVGIVTIASGFGTGYRVWGSRSAAWPTDTAPHNFIPVQRVADITHESIQLSMLPFVDKPINDAVIDAIVESVNAFIRTQIQRGALVDGNCTFDPDLNPAEEIALGHLTFSITMMPPPPLERLTFQSYIDINLLNTLTANS